MPALGGMNVGDCAVAVFPEPGASATGSPTAWPPPAQPAALANGPHAKKLTVPVGLPPVALPVTVAESWFWLPSTIDPLCGEELIGADAAPTVKHSTDEPSLEPL